MTTGVSLARAAMPVARIEALSPLLEYPGFDWDTRVAAARAALPGAGLEEARDHLDRFARTMSERTPAAREELHAATFDLSRQCVPYVSIHLFGEENFKRGAFMAALNARFVEIGFSAGGELPDHLAVLLRFLGEAADEGERHELVLHALFGPVEQMMASLPPTNPYRNLISAIQATLRELYPAEAAEAAATSVAHPVGSCFAVDLACGCHAPAAGEVKHG